MAQKTTGAGSLRPDATTGVRPRPRLATRWCRVVWLGDAT